MTNALICLAIACIFIGFKIGQWAQKRKVRQLIKVNEITPYQIGTTVYFMTQNRIYNSVVKDWEVLCSREWVIYTIEKNPAGSSYTTRFFGSEISDNIEDIKNKIVVDK